MQVLTDWSTATVALGAPGPRWVVIADAFASNFTSQHRLELEAVAHTRALGKERFTRKLPDDEAPALGDDGLVAVGTQVGPGDVLVGKVAPRDHAGPPEEKLLRAIFGREGALRDASLRVPRGVAGTVVEAALVTPGKDGLARARVVIAWECRLAVGDQLVLDADDGDVVTVCAIRPGLDADALLGRPWGSSQVRLAKVRVAEQVMRARATGPSSALTHQALGGPSAFEGEPIEESHARALAEGGGRWLLAEMFTIKADDVPGRLRAFESLVNLMNPPIYAAPGDPLRYPTRIPGMFIAGPPPGPAPIAIALLLKAELAALGFDVTWDDGTVRARWLGDAKILDRSFGEVKVADTISPPTFEPVVGGLFCDRIFGPLKDLECRCGKYQWTGHRGVVCERCGVEVTEAKVRRERFGHVDLGVPVPHPWCMDEIGLLLGIEASMVIEVLYHHAEIDGRTGGEALRGALEAVDLDRLAAGGAGPRAALAGAMLARGLPPTAFILRSLGVLPPDLRPMVALDNNRFAVSDLNDIYRRIINRSARARRQIELNAPEVIVQHECNMVFEAVGALFDNERFRGRDANKPMRGPGDRPLESILGAILVYVGKCLLSKRVDFSGRAMLVIDPTLDPGCCRLPASMARLLFRPMVFGRLEAGGEASTIMEARRALDTKQPVALSALAAVSDDYPALLVAGAAMVTRRISLWDDAAIAVDPRTAEALSAEDGEVQVFLPLTSQARAECARLEGGLHADTKGRAARIGGWFTALLAGGDARRLLVHAAIYGDEERLDDELVRLSLGLAPRELP